MKVLLLGSSGLLGHNVLRQLLREGHCVSTIVRRRSSLNLTGLPNESCAQIDIIEGSLLIPDILNTAIQGCKAIVNCCGITDMSLLHYEDYLPINRDVCTLLVNAMEQHDIRRLVHVSTANTIGYGSSERPANEEEPIQYPFSESLYARSKQAGEQILLGYASQHPTKHIIIVNPGFMIGPYDMHTSSGQLLMSAYRKPIMICPKGGKSFIDVRDVAHAIVRAIDHGISGKRYLLTGHNMSLADFFHLQATTMGYRQRVIVIPNTLALATAKVGDLLRCCGIKTQLSTINVKQLLVREYYCNNHATKHLHLPSSPISKAITDYFADHQARHKT